MDSLWTEERSETLKRLYAEKKSCAEIAAELKCGLSRNAVIGKIHRMKLPLRGAGTNPRPSVPPRPEKKAPPRPKIAPQPFVIRAADVIPRNIVLLDLEPADCRYPYGEDDISFCGHPQQEGSSYCASHHRLVYTKPIKVPEEERERRIRNFRRLNRTLAEAS